MNRSCFTLPLYPLFVFHVASSHGRTWPVSLPLPLGEVSAKPTERVAPRPFSPSADVTFTFYTPHLFRFFFLMLREFNFSVVPPHAGGAHPLSGATKDAKRSFGCLRSGLFLQKAPKGDYSRCNSLGSGPCRRISHTTGHNNSIYR